MTRAIHPMTLALVLAACACSSEPGGSNTEGDAAPGESCSVARSTLLGPVAAVSTGAVSVIEASAAGAVLFVDASAGGFMAQASNPYTYVSLATGERVDLTDLDADASTAWDIALKRDVIRANGGDSGPGDAQTAHVETAFEAVDRASTDSASFAPDEFLDDACEPSVDATGKPVTGFSSWYAYDPATMVLAPRPFVFLIQRADAIYKLQIESYYSTPEGAEGMTSARYRLRYAPL